MTENYWQKKVANDSPEQKRKKPLFAILVAILILVLAFLLLCVIPGGHKVLGVILPVPGGPPMTSSLTPIGFQQITPPAGGGSSRIVFPVGSTIVDVPPLLPSRVPRPTPTPIPTPAPERECSLVQTIVSFVTGNPCPASSTPKPGTPTTPPTPEEPKLMDFGDAPDGRAGDFPSLLESSGARHIDVTRFYLGKKVDTEIDAQITDRDSQNKAIGPDDGAASTPQAVGANITSFIFAVEVHNNNWPADQPMYLNALFDINSSLSWEVEPNPPNEHVLVDDELFIPQGESEVVSLTVSNIVNAPHWVRFTVTKEKLGAGYDGSWSTKFPFGETEDYVVGPFPPSIQHDEIISLGIPKEPPKVPVNPVRPPDGGLTVVPVVPKEKHNIITTAWQTITDWASGLVPKPAPATPTPGSTPAPVPTFDPNTKYPIKGITNPVTGEGPAVILYDPATGVYRHHDGVTSKFGDAVDDDFLKTHGIPPRPIPIFTVTFTLPKQGEAVAKYGVWDKFFQAITSPFSPLISLVPESYRPTLNYDVLLQNRLTPQNIIKIINIPTFVPLPVAVPTPSVSVPITPAVPAAGQVCNITGASPTSSENLYNLKWECSGFKKCEVTRLGLAQNSQPVYKPDPIPDADGKQNLTLKYPVGVSALLAKLQCDNVVAQAPSSISPFGLVAGSGTTGPTCQFTASLDDTLADGTASTAYSGTVIASGGSGYTYAVTSGSLPTGLSLSSGGSLTGTPTSAATYNFTITATDSTGCTVSRAYSITIASGCTISFSPTSLPNGIRLATYDETITATASDADTTIILSNQGISVNPDIDFTVTNQSPTLNQSTERVQSAALNAGTNSWTLRATPNGGSSCSVTNQAYSFDVP